MLYGGGGRKGEPGNRVSPLILHWVCAPTFYFPFISPFFHNHLFLSPLFSCRAPAATKEGRARGDSRASRGLKGNGYATTMRKRNGGKENAHFQFSFFRRVGKVPRGLAGTRAVRVRPGLGGTPGRRVGPGPRGRGASRGGPGCPRLAEEGEGKTAGRP